MPTFDYSNYHRETDEMRIKKPGLMAAANGLFVFAILALIALGFLAVYFPKTWFGVAVCVAPVLIILVPVLYILLWVKGRFG